MKKVLILMLLTVFLIFSCGKHAVKDEEVAEKTAPVAKVEKPTPPPKTDVVQVPTKSKEESTLNQVDGELVEVLDIVAEGDSVDIFYMVKPNDFLVKIAKNEYGLASMWKTIYKWNRSKIGDNPNLIYPFHEFLLKKPKAIAKPVEYSFYNYTVKQGETLWSIAGTEYNNNYGWIVILRDNASVLGSNLERIAPGTVLKLRTRLF
jgi:nucleoid-associated protein YgaU